jgi:hypothetical protein
VSPDTRASIEAATIATALVAHRIAQEQQLTASAPTTVSPLRPTRHSSSHLPPVADLSSYYTPESNYLFHMTLAHPLVKARAARLLRAWHALTERSLRLQHAKAHLQLLIGRHYPLRKCWALWTQFVALRRHLRRGHKAVSVLHRARLKQDAWRVWRESVAQHVKARVFARVIGCKRVVSEWRRWMARLHHTRVMALDAGQQSPKCACLSSRQASNMCCVNR